MPVVSTSAVGEASASRGPKLRVFISYSRKDAAFADEIANGLEFQGDFEVMIDRESIHEGEDWRARLRTLIVDADTIVFILSPASAASPICAWEVDEAKRLAKRIIPVLSQPLTNQTPPPQLAALNYIRFDPFDDGRARSFIEGLSALCRTLNTDIGWIREHTRLLTRAQEWDLAGRPENRLLIGAAVREAKSWIDCRPKVAPPITELHRDYISASEKALADRESAERQRAEELERAIIGVEEANLRARRALAFSIGLLGATGATGAYGWYQRQIAQDARVKLAALFNESENKRAALVLSGGGTNTRPDMESLRASNLELFRTIEIRPERQAEVEWYVRKLTDPANRSRYEEVSKATNTPWFVIGILHALEASFSFSSHLHNGDSLNARTVQVPAGRPKDGNPPFTWAESAVDAVRFVKWNDQVDWSVAATLYRFEAYNGFRSRVIYKINSPYIWSFSNHYTKGKFLADNVFDKDAVSKQCGVAVLLKRLLDLRLVSFPDLPPPATP